MSEFSYNPDQQLDESSEWIERPGFEGRLTSRGTLEDPVVLERIVDKYGAFKYVPDTITHGKGRLMILAASIDQKKE